jgi:glucose-1-phosphate cytidylyltransferase
MMEALAGHALFDAYAAIDQTRGALDFGTGAKLPHKLDDFRELGFEPQDHSFITHCADLLFEVYRRRLPDYDFYIMIEYDVDLVRAGGAFLDNLALRLAADAHRDLDLAGTHVSFRGDGWAHHAKAAALFATSDVHMVFFPLVVMSRRAIEHLYRVRLSEGDPAMPTLDRVFCEAFAATALLTDGRFNVRDLSDVAPGCYERRSFYWGLPMLVRAGAPGGSKAEVRHPVFSAQDFVWPHLHAAQESDTLHQYTALLQDRGMPLPDDVRASAERSAREVLDRRVGANAPSAPPPPATDAPPMIVLIEDDDLPVREFGFQPRSMEEISGKPVLRHVLEGHAGAGVRHFVICPGPRTAGLRAEGWAGPWRLDVLDTARPMSTIDRLRIAVAVLGGRRSLLGYGNVMGRIDISALLEAHDVSGKLAAAVTARASGFSLALDEAIGMTLDTYPKPGQLWSDAGCLVIEREALALLDRESPFPGLPLHYLAFAQQLTEVEHVGFCQPANSEREVAMLRAIGRSGRVPWTSETAFVPNTAKAAPSWPGQASAVWS